MAPDNPSLRVLVAGGGVAGLEATMALRDLARDRVTPLLMAPQDDFVYRPLAVAEPFALGRARRYPLAGITRDLGVELVKDALAGVDPEARTATTREGHELQYDALIVAIGARQVDPLKRALTWRPESDPEAFGGLLRDIEEGYVKKVAFVIPPGSGWPLPAYELALMTARQALGMGARDMELHIVTPEDAPLGVFGAVAAKAVERELDHAGIALERKASAVGVEPGNPEALIIDPGGRRLDVDRVVTLPRLEGPRVAGLPADRDGFLPIDDHVRVEGVERVWAAGDGTSFPIKQGGLATQMADTAAEAIADLAGARVDPQPFRPVMRGMLLTGEEPRFMKQKVGEASGSGEVAPRSLWWPPVKISGRYLAPYLAERDSAAAVPAPPPGDGMEVELRLDRGITTSSYPAAP